MLVRNRRGHTLAQLFSATHLRQLRINPLTEPVLIAYDVLSATRQSERSLSVASLLDLAFEYLRRDFPIEYVYKSCALERLLFGKHSPRTTAFYTEFRVGSSRADVLLVNGRAHVYEIKTRYDDLSRLSQQIHDYYRAFTQVTLFVDPVHEEVALKNTPEHTGIVVLSNRYSMRTVREASEYHGQLDHFQLFRLLRQQEYISILAEYGLEPENIDPGAVFRCSVNAFRKIDIGEAYGHVVAALRRRQRTEQLAQIAADLPRSLKLAPFAYKMGRGDWRNLSQQVLQRL